MATYNRLNPEDTTVSTDKVVSDTWTNQGNNGNILVDNFTSSVQVAVSTATSQGNFFYEVFSSTNDATVNPIEGEGQVQYTISYGHKAGSGSLNFTNTAGAFGNTATKCIYKQYSQLVFGDENSNFVFDSHEANDIWVINIARGRYKHALKAGSLNLKLDNASNIDFFTDDSVTQTGSAVVTNLGRQFNLVSGSDGVMSGSLLTQTSHLASPDSGSFGFVYPDAGIIIFNGDALRQRTPSFWTEGNAAATENLPQKLFDSIKKGASFELDSEERVSSQYMFVRVKNGEYNYSSNPSYIDTNGNLNNTTMTDSPTTYITTIGLYNDDNNLLAVAKLSQPLKKDFTTEALVRVKLDY
tara:strand:- start:757 stop:1821 length:1065 start_codon:yes stop_codon:yes gene_type:complete